MAGLVIKRPNHGVWRPQVPDIASSARCCRADDANVCSTARFRLLGPLVVVRDDAPVRLGRGKRRSLLALLLLHANEVVSQDRLIDALWGERPPAAPRTALQVLVSELRKDLGADRIVTTASGYVLNVAPAEIDAAEFAHLLASAEQALAAGNAQKAEERLREALALWRGPPLQDFAYEEFAQPEIARLEELRLQAEEQLVDAELAQGRGGELVPRLEALIARHPLRERLRGQLRALCGAGGRAHPDFRPSASR